MTFDEKIELMKGVTNYTCINFFEAVFNFSTNDAVKFNNRVNKAWTNLYDKEKTNSIKKEDLKTLNELYLLLITKNEIELTEYWKQTKHFIAPIGVIYTNFFKQIKK